MRKSTAELSLHFSHFVGNDPNPIYLQTSSPDNDLSWKTLTWCRGKVAPMTQIFTSLSQKTFSGDCSVSKQILSHLPLLAPKNPQTVRSRLEFKTLKAWIRIWASVNTKRCSSYPLRIESESLWTQSNCSHKSQKSINSLYGHWKLLTCPPKARKVLIRRANKYRHPILAAQIRVL